MNDDIRVIPAELRAAAVEHRQTAEYLAALPASHPEIQASLDSLGPIYRGLAEAGRELLAERRRSYEGQAADHAELARQLSDAAARWDRHEHEGAAAFGNLADDQ